MEFRDKHKYIQLYDTILATEREYMQYDFFWDCRTLSLMLKNVTEHQFANLDNLYLSSREYNAILSTTLRYDWMAIEMFKKELDEVISKVKHGRRDNVEHYSRGADYSISFFLEQICQRFQNDPEAQSKRKTELSHRMSQSEIMSERFSNMIDSVVEPEVLTREPSTKKIEAQQQKRMEKSLLIMDLKKLARETVDYKNASLKLLACSYELDRYVKEGKETIQKHSQALRKIKDDRLDDEGYEALVYKLNQRDISLIENGSVITTKTSKVINKMLIRLNRKYYSLLSNRKDEQIYLIRKLVRRLQETLKDEHFDFFAEKDPPTSEAVTRQIFEYYMNKEELDHDDHMTLETIYRHMLGNDKEAIDFDESYQRSFNSLFENMKQILGFGPKDKDANEESFKKQFEQELGRLSNLEEETTVINRMSKFSFSMIKSGKDGQSSGLIPVKKDSTLNESSDGFVNQNKANGFVSFRREVPVDKLEASVFAKKEQPVKYEEPLRTLNESESVEIIEDITHKINNNVFASELHDTMVEMVKRNSILKQQEDERVSYDSNLDGPNKLIQPKSFTKTVSENERKMTGTIEISESEIKAEEEEMSGQLNLNSLPQRPGTQLTDNHEIVDSEYGSDDEENLQESEVQGKGEEFLQKDLGFGLNEQTSRKGSETSFKRLNSFQRQSNKEEQIQQDMLLSMEPVKARNKLHDPHARNTQLAENPKGRLNSVSEHSIHDSEVDKQDLRDIHGAIDEQPKMKLNTHNSLIPRPNRLHESGTEEIPHDKRITNIEVTQEQFQSNIEDDIKTHNQTKVVRQTEIKEKTLASKKTSYKQLHSSKFSVTSKKESQKNMDVVLPERGESQRNEEVILPKGIDKIEENLDNKSQLSKNSRRSSKVGSLRQSIKNLWGKKDMEELRESMQSVEHEAPSNVESNPFHKREAPNVINHHSNDNLSKNSQVKIPDEVINAEDEEESEDDEYYNNSNNFVKDPSYQDDETNHYIDDSSQFNTNTDQYNTLDLNGQGNIHIERAKEVSDREGILLESHHTEPRTESSKYNNLSSKKKIENLKAVINNSSRNNSFKQFKSTSRISSSSKQEGNGYGNMWRKKKESSRRESQLRESQKSIK